MMGGQSTWLRATSSVRKMDAKTMVQHMSLVVMDEPRHKERNASCLVTLTVAPLTIPTYPDDAVA